MTSQEEFVASVLEELEAQAYSPGLTEPACEFLGILVRQFFAKTPDVVSMEEQKLLDFMQGFDDDLIENSSEDAAPKDESCVFSDEAKIALVGDCILLEHGIFDTITSITGTEITGKKLLVFEFANSSPQTFMPNDTLTFQDINLV